MTAANAEGPRRLRMLFLCQSLPYPPDGGANIRTYHVLRTLAARFDITALCFFRQSDRPSPADVATSLEGLRPLARVQAFPIPQEHSRLRLLWDHLRSLVTRRAYTVFAYESRAFRGRLRALLAGERFDVIHLESLDLAAYLNVGRGYVLVCSHQNVESTLLRRRASSETAPWRRRYLAYQADLLEREERRCCPRVAMNLAVSDKDAAELSRIAPGSAFAVVPNGVDTTYFQPSQASERSGGIVFVGGANWFPNRDALEYFSGDILPLLGNGAAAPAVRWVGRSTDADRVRFAERGVELTGYVADVRPFVRDAACYVVPLRVGGGTRLKILDAWAMGKAVVSTSVGCEGLTASDGVNILIRDEPAAFAAAVRQVLEQPQLRERLGREARATVERHYAWGVVGAGLLATYERLLAGSSP